MSDEQHPADRVLGANWRDPTRLLFEQAWDQHPQKDLLDRLQAERDEHNQPTWDVHQIIETDIVIYVLRPADDDDERGSVHIYAWPLAVFERELAKAPAIISEHDEAGWQPCKPAGISDDRDWILNTMLNLQATDVELQAAVQAATPAEIESVHAELGMWTRLVDLQDSQG